MMRWSLVSLVVLGFAAALAGTHGYAASHAGEVVDELLAYELTAERGVTVDVPAGVRQVQLTTWLVGTPSMQVAADADLAYGVEVALHPQVGKPSTRRYQTLSRPMYAETGGGVAPVARLAEGTDWLGDPRTLDVDVSSLAERGGRMKVRPMPGAAQRVLIRLSYRFSRSSFERQLVEKGLDDTEVRRLLGNTTILGFVDLSEGARAQVLSYWGRRLSAIGRRGTDYRMRRILVGAPPVGGVTLRRRNLAIELTPSYQAVLNLDGPVELRVDGEPGQRISVTDGDAAARTVTLGEEGFAEVQLDTPTPRSVMLSPEQTALLALSMDGYAIDAQLGDVRQVALPDGRFEVGPDFRLQSYFRLDPGAPIRWRVADAQGPFRISLRRLGPPALAQDAPPATVTARWRDPDGVLQSETLSLPLVPSTFDVFDPPEGQSEGAIPTTEAASAYLHPPPGCSEVMLLGPDDLAVAASVQEPDVDAGELAPAYQLPLPLDLRLRNAPFVFAKWATIRPADHPALQDAGRELVLRAQVRLEKVDEAIGPERPTRDLRPLGQPLRRELWVQRPLEPGPTEAGAPTLWHEVGRQVRVQVPETGPSRGRVELHFETTTEMLGGELRVEVDGATVRRQPLLVRRGNLLLQLPPGVHSLRIDGLGDEGARYVDAQPVGARHVIRRFGMFELARGRRLSFPVLQRPGEALTLLLIVATRGAERSVSLAYAIDDGRPRMRPGVFFRQKTEARGELHALSGELERGVLWEASDPVPRRVSSADDGVTRVSLKLGDDLAAPRHRVDVSLAPRADATGQGTDPDRVWVRAVLVGQEGDPRAAGTRQWIGGKP